MRKIVAAAATAALLATVATPAEARRWHHHHDGFGSFLTGALVVGGIAAIAGSGDKHRARAQDLAVRSCTGEAESRTGGHLLDVGHVSKQHGYFTVEGLIDGGRDAPRESFACTVREGTIYSFRASPTAG